jgi:hypothetical protein
MEAFAGGTGVHAVWSKEITRYGTTAVVTAIVLEDSSQPAQKMRGVRVDLAAGGAHDQIFLDEEATERTRAAMVEINDAVARRGIPGNGNGCMGAREFWPLYSWAWNKYHELNVDYCGGPGAYALVLHGRGRDNEFRLAGADPTSLASTLATALDELRQH